MDGFAISFVFFLYIFQNYFFIFFFSIPNILLVFTFLFKFTFIVKVVDLICVRYFRNKRKHSFQSRLSDVHIVFIDKIDLASFVLPYFICLFSFLYLALSFHHFFVLHFYFFSHYMRYYRSFSFVCVN